MPHLLTLLTLLTLLIPPTHANTPTYQQQTQTVTNTPGCIAFWDFVKREPTPPQRFTAHTPPNTTNHYPLDAANYIKHYWGEGRQATYNDFPQLKRGPFGNAILIRKETDPNFRPYLYIPRQRLHNTPIDLKGQNQSLTLVVWAIRESGNHALAGIWHEGTDLKQKETTTIQKIERGQRQYALFAGLNHPGSACGHLSENGASSFLNRYALHKGNSTNIAPEIPSNSPPTTLDQSWQCFAMRFDHQKQQLTSLLNGHAGDRWLDQPQKNNLISYAANAWLQGHLHQQPGLQQDEDPNYPPDQFYNPPEHQPLHTQTISETTTTRIQQHEYPYTKVKITSQKQPDGTWHPIKRELTSLRLNPWWYPHPIYTPNPNDGGPFTIGRVIHSSRSVGFTGWIGGVAIYNRALTDQELQKLSQLRKTIIQP